MKITLATCAAVFLTLFSCTQVEQSRVPLSESSAPEIEMEYDEGPLEVFIRVSQEEISIADSVTLEIEAFVDQEYTLLLPAIGEHLSEFSIKDYSTPPPSLVDKNRLHYTRSYTLEPFLSGEYTIPSLRIEFRKTDQDELQALLTEEVKIAVRSLLPEDAEELSIHGIIGPVDEPSRSWFRWWYAAVGVPVLAVAGVYLSRRLHRKSTREPEAVSPQEQARHRLEALLADDLISRGETKLFYQRVSDILRRYIENEFGLHAPEQTTEEFLHDMRLGDQLAPSYQKLLSEFLTHCDLVKFAEYSPSSEEIERTFNSCTDFIFATVAESGEK